MSNLPKLRTQIPYYLSSAIEEAFSPDPYLPTPDPETVEAMALLVLVVAQVTKGRRKSLANEPWKGKPAKRHLEHGCEHATAALWAVLDGDESEQHLDPETNLPQLAHATLRNAFALRQLAEVLHL
jgi:hypothetical protein